MKIKEWNNIQRWIDSLSKRSAAKREFYIKRSYPHEIRSEYFFFNEKIIIQLFQVLLLLFMIMIIMFMQLNFLSLKKVSLYLF